MADEGDRKICGEEFHDAVLLLEELHQFLVARIVFLHDSIGLVFRHRRMAVDRTTFEGEVDPVGFELIDKGLELTKEVVNDGVLASGKSTASTMGHVHEVEAEDGHGTIISRFVSTIHTMGLEFIVYDVQPSRLFHEPSRHGERPFRKHSTQERDQFRF